VACGIGLLEVRRRGSTRSTSGGSVCPRACARERRWGRWASGDSGCTGTFGGDDDEADGVSSVGGVALSSERLRSVYGGGGGGGDGEQPRV
jgi:hypothetical protein